ncbi:alpha-2,3-sialyltransferase, partial [Campylobacter jejuni]|uniref:alpha-2,3-sialyltransferase n=1 Tax=Campylobacter jejuni TaxID=197 RepID=UPI0008743BF0
MDKRNVVLIGGSTIFMPDGIGKGVKEAISKKIHYYNFALGACDNAQRLISCFKNLDILEKAQLVIVGTNSNDYYLYKEGFDINRLNSNLEFLCKFLSNLNTKVIFIIQPFCETDTNFIDKQKIINNLTKQKIMQYNFNYIDMQKYYEHKEVNTFFMTNDPLHQMGSIMQILGKNIIKNIHNFKKNNLKQKYYLPIFLIKSPLEIFDLKEKLEEKALDNSYFSEKFYKLNRKAKLKFKDEFCGYRIVGIDICNFFEEKLEWENYSSYILENKNTKIIKGAKSSFYLFHTLEKEFVIDRQSFIYFNSNNEDITEITSWVPTNIKLMNNLNYCGLGNFLLEKIDKNYHTKIIDFEVLASENIEISKDHDYSYLIPPVEIYKNIIEEYCQRMDPIKLAPLQNQIKEKDNIISTLNQEKTMLQNELNSFPIKKQNLEIKNLEQDLKNKELQSFVLKKELGNKFVKNININYIDKNSAKSRIQNHLSYKLGQALITNSKSILGYIRMPFVLSYIKDKHKFEQKAYEEKIKDNPNLALPPLETYPDYNEALKEKECFTYKLGE